ncbi:MAG: glycosyltransferase family 2 protein [archaeon]|nr:glycosyltransferase family 2 protein [archaeon]MDD2477634.1 glycosyltransferase family 2 protein [Candidatus ainarchaeum sp.]MDD3084271.1 glycosyltransferase family 2 protein [Candidatus ainarchaeum sp.]MDD4221012.1 glycosyltransferase family 2 protein [Candidatus ainarchaeum sp.]
MKFNLKKTIFFLTIFLLIIVIFSLSLKVSLVGFLILSSFYMYIIISFLIIYYTYPNIEDRPSFPKKVPTVAVITYGYNDFKPIIETVKSLKKLKYPIPFNIYVITDGTCSFLKKFKNVKLIPVDKKYFQKGRNIKAEIMNEGLKNITEENLFCVDGDTMANENALMEMTPFLQGKVASVNSLLVPQNTNSFFEKVQLFEYHINWGMSLRILSSMNSISIPVGGMFIIKNKVFRELNGYDVNNITEDRELGYRLLEKGYSIKFTSVAKSYTQTPSSLREWIKQRMRWSRGELATIYKHKHFLFNKKLGFFGTFTLPITFLLQTLGIAMAFGLIFNFFSRTFVSYYYLVIEFIKSGVFWITLPKFTYFYFPSTLLLVLVSTVFFMLYSINAFSLSNFKFKLKHLFPFIIFSTCYVFLIGFVYIVAIFLEMINYRLPIFKRET